MPTNVGDRNAGPKTAFSPAPKVVKVVCLTCRGGFLSCHALPRVTGLVSGFQFGSFSGACRNALFGVACYTTKQQTMFCTHLERTGLLTIRFTCLHTYTSSSDTAERCCAKKWTRYSFNGGENEIYGPSSRDTEDHRRYR